MRGQSPRDDALATYRWVTLHGLQPGWPPAVTEPTIADVLTRLDRMDHRADVAQLGTRAALAELRTGQADQRAALAELRVDVAELRSRVNLMFDFLADFRREYHEHTHGGEAA